MSRKKQDGRRPVRHAANPPPPRATGSRFSPSNIALGVLALAATILTIAWVYQQVKPEPSLADRLETAATSATDDAIAAAQHGDVSEAERVFFDKVHSVVHEIDFTLRQVNAQLSEETFNAKTALEGQFAGPRDATVIISQLQKLKGFLT